jgi:transposase-like protein
MSTEPKSVTRRHLGGEAKILILKEHLVEKKPVADVCETHGISPAQFYRWQQELFLNGCQALERKGAGFRGERQLQRQISDLESKLVRKNEALAELMEDYVALKKRNGGR